jgi:hypothetical protein
MAWRMLAIAEAGIQVLAAIASAATRRSCSPSGAGT